MTHSIRTQIGIVGAGPAGLMLAELLGQAGIDTVVLDNRDQAALEGTIKAGVLEHGAAELLVESGVTERAALEAVRHDGIEFQFAGTSHRFDFPSLVGRSVYLYPQHQVLGDLLAQRIAQGRDVRFSHTVEMVDGIDTATPSVHGIDQAGEAFDLRCDFVIGADGSHSLTRKLISGEQPQHHYREYPFGWFGILCEAPKSAEELIYANSERGFALISQRSEQVQRMYLQCDPNMPPDALSDEQIWDDLQACVPTTELKRGPIFQRDVLKFRSFVAGDFSRGRVFLAGDAAHTVPPTGAKGLNLAFGDVLILNRGLTEFYANGSTTLLDDYEQRASRRIWRAEHFSWWMTSMLHTQPESSSFDRRRQLGELELVTQSLHGQRYLAEAYTGWPYEF